MVFADLGGRIGRQVQSSSTQVLCSKEWAAVGRPTREAAMLPSPLTLWIDSYRGCGVRRLWKPLIWERPEHGCSAG